MQKTKLKYLASACYQPSKVPENRKIAIMHGSINFVIETSSRAHFKDNFTLINPLPHGHISSSRSGIRLLPQVEGQILRPNAPWRFLDRTSYKPSSSRYEIALYGLQV